MASFPSPTRKAVIAAPSSQLARGGGLGGGGSGGAGSGGGRSKMSSREEQPLVRVQKQHEELESLRHQNEMTRLDAVRGAREARVGVNAVVAKEVRRLQDQAELYLQRIQGEKRRIAELEGQIKAAQLKVLEQKQKTGGVNASKENGTLIAKQIHLLENRLDKELVKFNQALAENKNLRERIDRLRKDRVIFDNVYKRLESSLHEKKNEMTQVIEDAKRVCIARDKAKSELAAIKHQAEKDKAEFDREWKELGRLIEEDRRLRDALKRKIQDTAAQQRQQSFPVVSPSSGAAGDGLLGSKDAQQRGASSPIPLAGVVIKDNKAGAITTMTTTGPSSPPPSSTDPLAGIPAEKLQYYEEAFTRVQAATGIGDVDELVSKLLEAEEQNFSLFNYVNELNAEIEQLEALVAENQAEVERHKGHGASTDLQQKRLARAMEERLQRTRRRADEHEQRYAAAIKTINQLKTGIHGIFSRLGIGGGGASAVEEMLGNQGVTESNMMQYLGVIEQRAIEILQMYAASQAAAGGGTGGEQGAAAGAASAAAAATAAGVGIKPQQPPPPPLRLQVQLPTFDEVEGAGHGVGAGDGAGADPSGVGPAWYEDEEDDRPLTREELQRYTGLRRLKHSVSSSLSSSLAPSPPPQQQPQQPQQGRGQGQASASLRAAESKPSSS